MNHFMAQRQTSTEIYKDGIYIGTFDSIEQKKKYKPKFTQKQFSIDLMKLPNYSKRLQNNRSWTGEPVRRVLMKRTSEILKSRRDLFAHRKQQFHQTINESHEFNERKQLSSRSSNSVFEHVRTTSATTIIKKRQQIYEKLSFKDESDSFGSRVVPPYN
ncbi:hypothetical protein SNEBB_006808 [Seison nebaliae]|nr:hypothetical protein SNEBB_006808 [Seison nebaliae]